jgi:hypothetical protein
VDVPYFQSVVWPEWQRDLSYLRSATSLDSLADLGKDPAAVKAVLQTMQGALQSVKLMLGTGEQDLVELLVLDLAEALSAPADLELARRVGAKIQGQESLFTVMRGNPRLWPALEVLTAGSSWLL